MRIIEEKTEKGINSVAQEVNNLKQKIPWKLDQAKLHEKY